MTRHADVVVVGAGIAGASAAFELSTSHRVVLLEQEPLPAQHASGRSASVLSETSGHPAVCALAHLSRPFLASPPPGFVDHPLLAPRGLLWVGEAGDEGALDSLAARAAEVTTAHRLSAREVRSLLPSFAAGAVAAGGVHEPDAASIDTAALVEAYLRGLRRNGGVVATRSEVTALGLQDGSWWVETATGTWATDAVVNAGGAWADVVAGRAAVEPLGLTPMRRTAAITPAPADVVARWPLVMDVAGRYYCEPEPGGLLVSAADETPCEPCDATADEVDVALALDRVREASGLPLRAVRRAWAGLRTFAPDRVPVVGEEPSVPGFWWLAGQGGAGIKTAPAMARLLAGLVRGDPFPAEAVALGLTPALLSPGRLRSDGGGGLAAFLS